MLTAAIELARAGAFIFPCAPGSKKPLDAGGHGFLDATTDEEQVRRWWTATPDANIGIACEASRVLVLDLDPRNGGKETMARLESQLGQLPETLEVLTGGGGLHKVFSCPAGRVPKGKLGPGVDVKFRGYIMAPPSIHPSGVPYRWGSDDDRSPAALPPRWVEAVCKTERKEGLKLVRSESDLTTPYGRAALEAECRELAREPDGGRNNRLNEAAFSVAQLVAGGEIEASEGRRAVVAAGLSTGLSASEVERTVQSGWEAGLSEPRKSTTTRPSRNWVREEWGSSYEPSGLPVRYLNDGPPSPTAWVVDGLIPEESCLLLGAEEKTGKSWLAFDLAVCLVAGMKLLGRWEPVRTGPVLIYSPEGSWAARKQRLWGLCWGRQLDPMKVLAHVGFISARLNLADEGSLVELRHTIRTVRPSLLIIDPLITAVIGADENEAGQMQPVLNSVRDLIEESAGMSVLVAHHLSKSHRDRSSFHSLRGSSALGAWSDGLISLRRDIDEENQSRWMSVEHRDAPSPTPSGWTLEAGEHTGQLNWYRLEPCSAPDVSSRRKPGRALNTKKLAAVAAYIKSNPKALRAKIAKETGISFHTITNYLRALVSEGIVRESQAQGHTYYEAADDA